MQIKWTPELVEIVRTMYPTSTYEEIAALIPNLSYSALQTKAKRLGVVKSEEYRLAVVDKAVNNSVKARKGKPTWNAKEHPAIICEICGKEFTVKAYMADDRRFCSLKCKGVGFRGVFAGDNNPRYNKVEHACIICGKPFMVKAVHDARGRGLYCSKECQYPPHVEMNCQWCNVTFLVTPGVKEKGERQFCSASCRGSYSAYIMGLHLGPTSIEVAVKRVLIELDILFVEQKQIGHWLADFYLPEYNLVLECDGDYWHSLPKQIEKDARRDKWMKSKGYSILRLPENKIKANALQCVVDGLAQQGINPTPQPLQLSFDL
jgi:very-short-patch-repair endonuclease/endogenous inhibitor of DNA gyrase (YacG/DUF329 family)